MVNKKIIAIIPARGGSKRIPKKNVIELGGKPMIAWTIEAALKSKYVSKVVVSTDDEEIALISEKYGAEVPFLRDENADDHSPVSMATVRTIKQMTEAGMEEPEIVVQLMANCPNRGPEDIDRAVENFISNDLNFQISCFKFGWMNPWWAVQLGEKGKPLPLFDREMRERRSQDQPDLYCPTGAIWIAKVADLLESKTFYGQDHSFFSIHWTKAVDIDDNEDLQMAKYFMGIK